MKCFHRVGQLIKLPRPWGGNSFPRNWQKSKLKLQYSEICYKNYKEVLKEKKKACNLCQVCLIRAKVITKNCHYTIKLNIYFNKLYYAGDLKCLQCQPKKITMWYTIWRIWEMEGMDRNFKSTANYTVFLLSM